jgi:hypothetical protein
MGHQEHGADDTERSEDTEEKLVMDMVGVVGPMPYAMMRKREQEERRAIKKMFSEQA